MTSIVLAVLLIVANVTGVGMILPQVVRLHSRRVVDGLSGVGVGVGIAMNMWWVAYAVQGSLWGIAPVSGIGVMLYTIMAWQYSRILGVEALRSLSYGALGLTIVPLVFLVIAGWSAAGLAIGLCYGAQFAPAARTVARSTRLDGISPMTWTLAWIEAVVWLPYGAATHDHALLVGGGGGALMASFILVRLARYASSTDRAGAAPDRPSGHPWPILAG